VDTKPIEQNKQYKRILSEITNLDDILANAVAPADVVGDAIRRGKGFAEVQVFIENQQRKVAENMIIDALKSNFSPEVIEVLQKSADISDDRLAVLKMRAQRQ